MVAHERHNLLMRLCPGDTSIARQKALDFARLPGSGQWFLDKHETQKWLYGTHSTWLWVHGATGKTFISSRMVNHVQSDGRLQQNTTAVAGVYLEKNDVQYNLADFNHAMSSVARQLVSQLQSTSGLLRQLTTSTDIPFVGSHELYATLKNISSEFYKVFIVIDGVDAASESGLKGLMRALIGNDIQSSPFRVLITSRHPPPDGFLRMHEGSVINARASITDIEKYIDVTLQKAFAGHQSSPEQSASKSQVVSDLVRISDGVFLPLPIKSGPNSILETLATFGEIISTYSNASLSDKTSAFCDKTMMEIMSGSSRDLVLCVLYHLERAANAGYFFTLPMAYEALDAWGVYNQQGSRYTVSDIIQACAELVFIDTESEAMRVRSPLLENYLRQEEFRNRFDEKTITASLRYLSRDEFAGGACLSRDDLKTRFQNHRYLWYVARLLSINYSKCIPKSLVADFVKWSSRTGSIETYLQAAEAWPYLDEATYNELEEYEERWACFTPGYGPLHLATHLGGPVYLIDALVEQGQDLEARARDGRTALHMAAEIEDESDTLRALLAHGSNISAVDKSDETALSIAVVHGNLEAVKLLIGSGADISLVDESALLECSQERPDIAQYLVGLGVDVPFEDGSTDSDI